MGQGAVAAVHEPCRAQQVVYQRARRAQRCRRPQLGQLIGNMVFHQANRRLNRPRLTGWSSS